MNFSIMNYGCLIEKGKRVSRLDSLGETMIQVPFGFSLIVVVPESNHKKVAYVVISADDYINTTDNDSVYQDFNRLPDDSALWIISNQFLDC
jgi:hypothetical protein